MPIVDWVDGALAEKGAPNPTVHLSCAVDLALDRQGCFTSTVSAEAKAQTPIATDTLFDRTTGCLKDTEENRAGAKASGAG